MRRPPHRPPARGLAADAGGAAYVEFLIAFLPLFTLFLGMVQWALMGAADLVVQHAASRAVRSAVVVLDDDPERYDGAARLRIDMDGSSDVQSPLTRVLGVACPDPTAAFGGSRGGPRIAAIRQAAGFPLIAIAPSSAQLRDADSVRTAIDDPACRATAGSTAYNAAALAVTFPSAPGSSSLRTTFARDDQVTARVTYAFHCGVPLINRLMCETYPTLRHGAVGALIEDVVRDVLSGRLSREAGQRRIERLRLSRDRHERDGPAAEELDSAANAEMLYLTSLSGSRYKLLQSEATMPMQGSRYEY